VDHKAVELAMKQLQMDLGAAGNLAPELEAYSGTSEGPEYANIHDRCVALPECGREGQAATDCREPPSGGGKDEGGSGAGTSIQNVTRMGNLSMAYETVDAEMSAEHYGNLELLESAQGCVLRMKSLNKT
jgi:hypothetical protein